MLGILSQVVHITFYCSREYLVNKSMTIFMEWKLRMARGSVVKKVTFLLLSKFFYCIKKQFLHYCLCLINHVLQYYIERQEKWDISLLLHVFWIFSDKLHNCAIVIWTTLTVSSARFRPFEHKSTLGQLGEKID